MDRSLINDYLIEFSKRPLPDLVQRELNVSPDRKFVTSIVGPRRSGKTFYFFQLIRQYGKNESLYLNFEDTRLMDISYMEIRDVIRQYAELFGKYPEYLFFDEIQNVKKWEAAIRELHDLSQYYIFLTGSSSKLLSKEISTQMRGRALTYYFLPFSFSEYLRLKNFKTERLSRDEEGLVKHMLKEYLDSGGFPDVVSSNLKEKILKEYFDSILFKDVVERHSVRNLHLVSLIFKQMVNNFSREFSVNLLYNTFKSQGAKVSKDTLYKYLNYFEDSVSVFFLKRYSEKLRLKEGWPRKVYLSDTGLSRVLRFSADYGRLMENCVFLHLLRMKNKRPLLDISYSKDYRGREVDFVLSEGAQVTELIQVCYDVESPDTKERETSALLQAMKNFALKEGKIVTWDYEDEGKIDGIKVIYIPLWKWLLNREE